MTIIAGVVLLWALLSQFQWLLQVVEYLRAGHVIRSVRV